MLQHTVPAVVDTRIWNGTDDPNLIKWLGEDTHRFDGHQLVLQTSDGDVYPEPGWTLLRWPDGDLTAMSTRAAAKRLTPTTAAPSRVQEEWIAKYGNRPAGTAHDVEVLRPPHDEIETPGLREQIADPVRRILLQWPEHNLTVEHDQVVNDITAAVLAAVLPAARITATLGRMSDADVQRVIALYEHWVKAGPPPLGTLINRWWDHRLAELHAALLNPSTKD
ncbi:hypothetical protein [Streptomyces stelliscabiei]|uniref:Uncharacterized protein n=1 Tax=Streptomyces stelliscabiei TaxID=146820 RepID=A0A8I0P4V6_9ACTN|nr:hypothetical protein [Streptomyces stelliscabiei]KND29879.1 hypothetical protein IQ64_41740 [Streptomyces stelliscabiei]MBE1598983.1 hypothetical protein [Streptomyces stelliscabiei]MBE1599726.1 hypothetical protein [Streptomyces stelliscabiei]MDX2519385.1 hypothetical protein [Streptomyces stelliscabiei]MDX2549686.1 hypothetical protein [Streptomyces stelliscabiei]